MPLRGHPVDRAFHRRILRSLRTCRRCARIVHGALRRSAAHATLRRRILQCSMTRATLLRIRRVAMRRLDARRLSPPPPPLVDSAQGSNALGFFLGAPHRAAAKRRRMMRRRMITAAGDAMAARDEPSARRAASRAAPARRRLPAEDPDRARLRRRHRDRRSSRARNLSARLGNHVLLKREDTQPVFSFKLRGAYNKMAHLTRRRSWQRGVICASAGNHAQGVALGARAARLPGGDRDAGDHAAAQGRRRARARRRGRAARRQLLRRLRPRARARDASAA